MLCQGGKVKYCLHGPVDNPRYVCCCVTFDICSLNKSVLAICLVISCRLLLVHYSPVYIQYLQYNFKMVTYNFKGSSSCDYCNDPITLRGNRWKNDKSNGLFALRVIALVVFLICLGLMIMFKWTKANGARDRLRSVGYFIATASGIM